MSSPVSSQIRQRYLAHSAQVNSTQTTLFHLISRNDPVQLIDFLQSIPRYQTTALLNAPHEKLKMTPIVYAIRCSANHLILILLLRSGAVFENGLVSQRGDHPLLLAVRAGNVNYVKILLAVNANVNVLDGDGYSLLHWACFKGNVLLARVLLYDSDYSYHNHDRNSKKITPLGIAVEKKHPELIRELCKCKKIDVNIIDAASKRFVYDLAAEAGFYFACHVMEQAFKGTSKQFHLQHEYQIHFAIQHQLRNTLFKFVNDPRGAFTIQSKRVNELPFETCQWHVYCSPEMQDSADGWVQSYAEVSGHPLAVNWSGTQVIPGSFIFTSLIIIVSVP